MLGDITIVGIGVVAATVPVTVWVAATVPATVVCVAVGVRFPPGVGVGVWARAAAQKTTVASAVAAIAVINRFSMNQFSSLMLAYAATMLFSNVYWWMSWKGSSPGRSAPFPAFCPVVTCQAWLVSNICANPDSFGYNSVMIYALLGYTGAP